MDDPLSFIGIPFISLIPLVINSGFWGYIAGSVVLLVCSAFTSASEIAFFSVTRKEIDEMNEGLRKNVVRILKSPKKLLATILITNTVINLSIVILSELIKEDLHLSPDQLPAWAQFFIQVVIVTFIILLFGEVIPKVYATQNPKRMIKIMVRPIIFLNSALIWLSAPLMLSSSLFGRKLKNKGTSMNAGELEAVINLTNDDSVSEEEKKIWKGIVEFGTIAVKETMKPRIDVVAVDVESSFREVISIVLQAGYSRLPVYRDSFDKIEGVLYIKDLLPYLDEEADFAWQSLIRETYFVPENKKIDDLLKEFQEKKMHLAVVVDEYGGTAGIVTLEDVIEEIVGEINDEFDDEEIVYSKLDDNNFVFDGKTSLINMCRIIDIEYDQIEAYSADADSIAGLLLNLNGKLPVKEQIIEGGFLRFKVEAVDKRRIKTVKVTKMEITNEEE